MTETPRQPRRRSPLPLVLGGLCAALVGGAGAAGISWANSEVYSPTAPVERYLEALQEGDGGTALSISQAVLPQATAPGGTVGTALLDGELLASSAAPLEDLQVHDSGHETAAASDSGAAGPDAERRQIEVTGTSGGTPFRTVFTVTHEGTDWLFFDRWSMDPVRLPTVTVDPRGLSTDPAEASAPAGDAEPENAETAAGPLTATLNGAQLPLTGADGSLVAPRLAVFPPADLTARFQSSHLASDPAHLTVARPGQDEVLPVTVTATELAAERLQEQVAQYLEECTQQQVLHPTGCPLDHESTQRVDPSSIRWEITQMPQLGDVQAQLASDGPSVVQLEGTAQITLSETDLMTGEQRSVSEDVPVDFEGTVLVTPESVRFTPQVR